MTIFHVYKVKKNVEMSRVRNTWEEAVVEVQKYMKPRMDTGRVTKAPFNVEIYQVNKDGSGKKWFRFSLTITHPTEKEKEKE